MGIHEEVPESCSTTAGSHAIKTVLSAALRPIVAEFLETLQYTTPPKKDDEPLKKAMISFAELSGIPYKEDKHVYQCFVTGRSVASDMYPSHPLPIQLHIAIFTWLGFLIDDLEENDNNTSTTADDLALFQSRFYTSQPQPTRLLECFAQNLRETYQHWDHVTANFIVLSALAFVNANTLERRRDYRLMEPLPSGGNWAYHFRNIEGLPEVYTYFMFPRAEYPDISAFLQAVPDMGRFINLTNDVLSFYKEEIAGETKNYIHSRTKYDKKVVLATMRDVAVDCAEAYLRASDILAGKDQYEKVWHGYVMGYVAMHLKSTRYLLVDLVPEVIQKESDTGSVKELPAAPSAVEAIASIN